MFGSQPFTSALVMSNPKWFKYEIIWDKGVSGSFANAKYQMLKTHENIMLFSNGKTNYNPQMTLRDKVAKIGGVKSGSKQGGRDIVYNEEKLSAKKTYTHAFPKSIHYFSPRADITRGLHPTQKPVALLEYLIKTYTNEYVKCNWCGGSGEVESLTIDCDIQTCSHCKGEGVVKSIILDNTCGSGSTGVACVNLNRNFIGIEMNDKYFDIASKRINEAQRSVSLFSDCP